MDIRIKGRKPEGPDGWPLLGVEGDAGVETVRFLVPRYTGSGVDLSQGLAYVGCQLQDGGAHAVSILGDDREIQEDTILLRWLVGAEATAQPGRLKVALKISGLDGELWHSEAIMFTVASTIPIESPQPVLFRSLMDSPERTAQSAPALRTANPDTEPPITVSERTLNIPPELQNIAVQNDRNSETVTIVCPRYFDGHDLSKYSFYLRTTNSNGGYDPVSLSPAVAEQELRMQWTLRPPQTSYNGKLSIQLWVTGSNFDWQTAEASVNIIKQIGGEPAVPVTPPVLDEFLKQISGIAENAKQSEGNAAASAKQASASAGAAAASANTAKQHEAGAASSAGQASNSAAQAKGFRDETNSYRLQAEASAGKAAESAAGAESAQATVKVYRDEAQAFSGLAQAAAGNAANDAQAAAASKADASAEADRARREADRSDTEADRAEAEANRARDIANLWFTNPHTGQLDLLQSILTENFEFLFGLIRKLHNLGLTWRQINEKGLTWRQINALHLTWREINVLGITATKIADIRNTLMGR